jgi:hypothetical protein
MVFMVSHTGHRHEEEHVEAQAEVRDLGKQVLRRLYTWKATFWMPLGS